MRPLVVSLALLASTAPPAGAEPPVWVPTVVAQAGFGDGVAAFADGTAYALEGWTTATLSTGQGTPVEADVNRRAHSRVLVSRDFGATWEKRPEITSFADDVVVHKLAMATPRVGWLVAGSDQRGGLPDVYGGGISRTTDGARTWSRLRRVPARPGHRFFLDAIRPSPSGRSLLIAGQTTRSGGGHAKGAEVVWVADGGATMRRAHLGAGNAPLSAVAVLDDRRAVVTVRDWPNGTDVWATADAGRSWRRMSRLTETDVQSVDYAAPDRLFVAGWRSGSIYVSRDHGRLFGRVGVVADSVSDDTHPPQAHIDFVSREVGFAISCLNGLWRTVDGGETWTQEQAPNEGDCYATPFGAYDEVAAAGQERAVATWYGGVLTRVP